VACLSKGAIYQEAFQTCEQLASTGINILQMELPVLFNAIQETTYFLSISLPEAARRFFTELSRYTRTQEKQGEIERLDSDNIEEIRPTNSRSLSCSQDNRLQCIEPVTPEWCNRATDSTFR
jgi:hypothetical protein